ncbi:MAG: hypothetical protein F6K37_10115 [Moorea sp. SIO4E2]|uniref:hypothetical protein n=1 Tax=Moorena sp. SIO4E2 TaxID=2607826 RepID=UPI0013B710E8|nr:hypothetical protein [Moorena sp. SIO4E2]NEQ06288.1 hypothetical protein [Moorena sp. SIO4E2]
MVVRVAWPIGQGYLVEGYLVEGYLVEGYLVEGWMLERLNATRVPIGQGCSPLAFGVG